MWRLNDSVSANLSSAGALAQADRTTHSHVCMEENHEQASLYERLGGEAGIRTFVTDVLKLHHANPIISPRYDNAKKSDAELIELVVDLTCAGTGGPQTYKGMSMLAAHKGMNCSEQEFIAVLDDIVSAMKTNGVDPQAQSDLFWILYGMKPEIVRG